MTREEAIERLNIHKSTNVFVDSIAEAIDMAIEALQAEPNKAVSPSLADVYKWERDIALSQLEEYGICFAEKKRDNLVWVVRCKDCDNFDYDFNYCNFLDAGVDGEDFFCAYGERSEK